VYPVLPFSLDCRSLLPPCVPGVARFSGLSFLIAPCVPGVAPFSGLSFFIAPLCTRCRPFLWIVVLYCPLVYPVLPISLDCRSLLPPCLPGIARFSGLSFFIASLCTRYCPFLWIVVLYCPLVYPVLPVSLDCRSLLPPCVPGCPFLWIAILYCPLVYPVLPVSLDCRSLLPPSIFSNVVCINLLCCHQLIECFSCAYRHLVFFRYTPASSTIKHTN
jgi:hypothetical protein